jgi:chorismate dehydratase
MSPPPLRVGKIPFANLHPLFHALETRFALPDVRIVCGHPAELNRMLREGRLDISPSSSIEYAKHPGRYLLCPGISVSSRRKVMSVLLLSNMPLPSLPPDPIAVTGSSDTSVVLLEILLRESLGKRNALLRTSLPPAQALLRHPAYLAIGDEAIRASLDGKARHATDLGEWWYRETGTPFVFALWIVSREAVRGREDSVRTFVRILGEAKRVALGDIARCPDGAPPGPEWIPADFLREYWRNLSYDLDREMEGLVRFFRLAAKLGRIPAAPPLEFLEVP